jgi:hypothetical protein
MVVGFNTLLHIILKFWQWLVAQVVAEVYIILEVVVRVVF